MCLLAGFNASLIQRETVIPRAGRGICPTIVNKAQSPSMMKHATILAKDGIAFLNPDQTPVIGADQPLYTILKQLQTGRGHIFCADGGLHIFI